MSTPLTAPWLVDRFVGALDRLAPPAVAYAHCDIPCGIYDPHMAQIAALTVVRMVQLIQGLQQPGGNASKEEWDTYGMQISRYTAIKEEHARIAEHEVIILWTDYFKPEHLEKYPNLHELFWKATKEAGLAKKSQDPQQGQGLLDAIAAIDKIFWETKKAA